MGEISKALAAEESFEWGGKTYRLSPMSYEAISAWERYLKGRAWRELEAAAEFLSPAAHEKQSEILQRQIASGAYSFFSQASLAAQTSWDGMQELMCIRVGVAQPNLDPADVRRMVKEIQESSVAKWQELQRKAADLDHDPNPSPPGRPGEAAGTSTPSAPSSAESPSA